MIYNPTLRRVFAQALNLGTRACQPKEGHDGLVNLRPVTGATSSQYNCDSGFFHGNPQNIP
jgi:hypothetical protein